MIWIFYIIFFIYFIFFIILIKKIISKIKYNSWIEKLLKIQPILNKNELNFYFQLKKFLEWKNYLIFSKVRLADFLKIDNNLNYWYKNKILKKIWMKHIDFLVTDYESNIIFLIELDWFSHNFWQTKKNDIFKNELFKKLNLNLYRFKNSKYYNLNILEQKKTT